MSLFAIRHLQSNDCLLVEADGTREALEAVRGFDGFADGPWEGKLKPTLLILGDFESVPNDEGTIIAVAGERRCERTD